MSARHQFELRLAIEIALKRRVPDNFISGYSDFVKWRELLPYMRYNQRVMHALAEMTTELWSTTKKVNRFQLLRCMSRYSNGSTIMDNYGPVKKPELDLLPETDELLFNLCLKIMTAKRLPVSIAQTEGVRSLANRLLMRVKMNDDRVDRLIKALPDEPKLVNRLLRYHEPQSKISAWAREQVNNPEWAYRRGDVLAWVINDDPDFELTDEMLRADFREMNRRDSEIAGKYLHNLQEQKRLQHEFPDLFGAESGLGLEFSGWAQGSTFLDEPQKEAFKELFPKRPGMKMPSMYSTTLQIDVPDLEAGQKIFEENLPKIKSNAMLRAILHCHLPAGKRLKLFKKYYHPENDFQARYVAKKLGNVEILRWLLQNRDKWTDVINRPRLNYNVTED